MNYIFFRSRKNVIIGDHPAFNFQFEEHHLYKNQTFAFLAAKVESQVIGTSEFNQKIMNADMKILEDDYFVNYEYLFVLPGSFIYEPLSKFIMRFNQHGFTKRLEYWLVHHNLTKTVFDEKQTLTLQILSAGFILWLCSVLIACLLFIVEYCVGKTFKNKIYKS